MEGYMRVLLSPIHVIILALYSAQLLAQPLAERSGTLIGAALSWYNLWWGSGANEVHVQTCEGEFRANLYSFRCDPLSVVVDVAVEKSGECSIIFMRPSRSPQDGLRVQTMSHILRPSGAKSVLIQRCGELPVQSGHFKILVVPILGAFSDSLTGAAREAAFKYRGMMGDNCSMHIPRVRTGDPFVHVYEECKDSYTSVLEFTIRQGVVSESPHWTYTQKRTGLPVGFERRRSQIELWLDAQSIR